MKEVQIHEHVNPTEENYRCCWFATIFKKQAHDSWAVYYRAGVGRKNRCSACGKFYDKRCACDGEHKIVFTEDVLKKVIKVANSEDIDVYGFER